MSDIESVKTKPSRRLWVVSELYYPEETSTGYYMTRIAEGLADDFDVHAVSGFPNYLYKEKFAPAFEIRNQVSIHRLWSTRLDKNRIPLKALNMLTFGIAVLLFGLRRFKRGDRVLVVTTPPTIQFSTAIVSLLKGLGMTLLVHDTYPEILHASGKLSKDSWVYSLLQSVKNWTYKMAEGVIVVGRDMEELASSQTRGLETRIVEIPNWAELETVFPDEHAGRAFRSRNGLTDEFVIMYAGNMGYPNDLETILEAATLLKGDDGIRFVFLGGGAKRDWLEKSVSQLGLRNVSLLPPQPREEQRGFLNSCDIGVVSLVPSMTGVSVPSRTYNLMAAGKPILGIVDPQSEVGRLILEDGLGVLIPHGGSEELADWARKASIEREGIGKMGALARTIVVDRFNQESAIDRYRRFMG
jgi:glycosyltransferase involved in cell wall biosynthesis